MELKQKLVYGWGINDSKEKCTGCKAQSTWRGILERCFSEKFKLKHPTYSECSVCEEWKYFSDFKKWYDLNYIPNYDLDKDILFVGNKHYSPDTCCFVPSYVNCVLLKQNRNHLPVGVSQARLGKTYQAKVSINNVNTLIGCFKSAAEAHIA